MTTALQRTPRLGERWYFVVKGKVLSGSVVCVERRTAAYSSPVKQIHLYRRNGGKHCEFRLPPEKVFSSHTGLRVPKPKKLARLKLTTFDREES